MSRRVLATITTVLAALVLVGCASASGAAGSSASKAASFSISGAVDVPTDYAATELVNGDFTAEGPCGVSEGYQDISAGTQVVVTDAAGATVALGQLLEGQLQGDEGQSIATTKCRFPFTVAGIPAGQKFYGVEVSHRGKLQYTEEQLRAGNLALTIGS